MDGALSARAHHINWGWFREWRLQQGLGAAGGRRPPWTLTSAALLTRSAGSLPDYSPLKELTSLQLQGNKLRGKLGDRLPPSLRTLKLHSNMFEGKEAMHCWQLPSASLHSSICKAPLRQQRPHSPAFHPGGGSNPCLLLAVSAGSLPASWAAYSQTLAELTLYSCPQLEGSIPEEWAATGWPASPESGGHVLM